MFCVFRCNGDGALSSLYTALLNHHNNVALELSKLNPHWSDTIIYQETKKIVVAEIQHVTYNEFLPVILGDEAVEIKDLKLVQQGFYDGYSSQYKGNTINEVATSIFPIFRTMYSDEWVGFLSFGF